MAAILERGKNNKLYIFAAAPLNQVRWFQISFVVWSLSWERQLDTYTHIDEMANVEVKNKPRFSRSYVVK